MTLKQIMERCHMLGVNEQRHRGDAYHELVFYQAEIDQWTKIFSGIFGPAVKPEGAKPTKALLELTRDYGGIWPGQTLFKKDFDDVTVIAMFWPWQDGIHATLKMALLEKEQLEVTPSSQRTVFGLAGLRVRLGKILF
jgi:hypothetical protein